MNDFSPTACIRFGWETFKKRPWYLIGVGLLYVLVLGVVGAALDEIAKIGPAVHFVTSIADAGFQTFAGMGMVFFTLKAHDDVEHVTLNDFWHPQPFWKYFLTSLLVVIITFGGLLLLIVPGIIWGIMFGFACYIVVDRGFKPMDALHESRRLTDGHKWQLFQLGLLNLLILVLGLVCLLVGIFVAITVMSLSTVHAYRTLSAKKSSPAVANSVVA